MDSSKRFAVVFVLVAVNLFFTIRAVSLANPVENSTDGPSNVVIDSSNGDFALKGDFLDGAVLAQNPLPELKITVSDPIKTVHTVVTGYSSEVGQTDDTPFITASGSRVRPGVAASSFLPFGTKFRAPALFGDKVFVVEDTMNTRYKGLNYVDIWFPTTEEAQKVGKRSVKIEIL